MDFWKENSGNIPLLRSHWNQQNQRGILSVKAPSIWNCLAHRINTWEVRLSTNESLHLSRGWAARMILTGRIKTNHH